MPGRSGETRERLCHGFHSGRDREWKWDSGWDGEPFAQTPACTGDHVFSVQGLGEKGGLGSLYLCKSCSAAAGTAEARRRDAKEWVDPTDHLICALCLSQVMLPACFWSVCLGHFLHFEHFPEAREEGGTNMASKSLCHRLQTHGLLYKVKTESIRLFQIL